MLFSRGWAILVLSAALSVASGGTTLFEDGFDKMTDGEMPGAPWYCHRATAAVYRVEAGRLAMSSASSNLKAEVGRRDWRDCVVSADVIHASGGNWLGIEGPGQYRLTVDFLRGAVTFAGPGGKKELTVGALKEQRHYQLRLFYRGNRVKATVNHVAIGELTAEKAIPGGGVQLLGSWSIRLFWSNIRVEALSEEEFLRVGEDAAPAPAPAPAPAEENREAVSPVATLQFPGGGADFLFPVSTPITSRLRWDSASEAGVKLEWKLIDYFRQVVKSAPISLDPGAKEVSFSFEIPQYGPYRLEVSADGKMVAEATLGALRPMRPVADPMASPYGIAPLLDPFHVKLAAESGAKWLRLHDMDLATYWPHVEPEKGKFVWRDEAIDRAVEQGFSIMGGFEGTPVWASDAPEEIKRAALTRTADPCIWRTAWGYPPRNLDDVERYVRETVRHYKGRIKAYEIWNEPHVDLFWKGSVQQYVRMSELIYRVAKEEDPECIIVGGGGINLYSRPWLEEAFKRGLLEHLDVLSIHGLDQDAIETVDAEEINSWTGQLFELMERYGRRVPVWMTEGGGGSPSFLTDPRLHTKSKSPVGYRDASARLIRSWVIGRARGLARLFWWRMRKWPIEYHRLHQAESMVEYTGAPKPSYYAHRAMADELTDAAYVGAVATNAYVRCEVFERPDAAVGVIWTVLDVDRSAGFSFPPIADFRLLNLLGNPVEFRRTDGRFQVPVGYEPAYLIAPGLSGKELQKILADGELKNFYLNEHQVAGLEKSAAFRKLLEDHKRPFDHALQQPDAAWVTVDLRPYANMGFADEVNGDGIGGWIDGGPYNDMRDMPLGRRTYCAVPFDIIDPAANAGKSVITLRSPHGPGFPLTAEKIAVGEKLTRMYFFNSCAWGANAGLAARIVIAYADGSKAEIPLTSGVETGDWWLPPTETETARVAAIPTCNYTVYQYRIKYLRILEWLNPHPEKEIASFDFVSADRQAIPVLLAVSGLRRL